MSSLCPPSSLTLHGLRRPGPGLSAEPGQPSLGLPVCCPNLGSPSRYLATGLGGLGVPWKCRLWRAALALEPQRPGFEVPTRHVTVLRTP